MVDPSDLSGLTITEPIYDNWEELTVLLGIELGGGGCSKVEILEQELKMN